MLPSRKHADFQATEISLIEIQEKRRRRRSYRFRMSLAVLLIGLALGAAWAVFRSPIFEIREIKVYGNDQVSEQDVIVFLQNKILGDSRLNAFLGFRNFLVWPRELASEELREFPALKRIAFSKDYREKKLTVEVTERLPFGVWCLAKAEEHCYWFDEAGLVLDRAPIVEGNLIPRVTDETRETLSAGSGVLPGAFMPSLVSIFRVLQDSRMAVKDIRLEQAELQELKAITYRGPLIYFSLRFPADQALAVIRSFEAKPSDELNRLEYLDFRTENRAYYR